MENAIETQIIAYGVILVVNNYTIILLCILNFILQESTIFIKNSTSCPHYFGFIHIIFEEVFK